MKIKVGGKYYYHTYRVGNGIKLLYYPGGVIGFKEKDQNIHSVANKKHLKKGWHEDED